MLTLHMVHFGSAPIVLAQRQAVRDAAYLHHPNRFVRRPPTASAPPSEVGINLPPRPSPDEDPH